jgi:diguanylate cyclase (GGDEF)-like protein
MKTSFRSQLHVGFLVTVLFALAAIGTAWWVTLQHEMHIEWAQRTAAAGNALGAADSALSQLRYHLEQYRLGDSAARKLILEDEQNLYTTLESNLNAYAGAVPQESGAAALAQLRAAYLRYKEARPRFFELYDTGRVDDANEWRTLTLRPYGDDTASALEKQIMAHRATVEQTVRVDLEELRKDRRTLVYFSALLLLLLAILYLAALGALRRIRALQARARSVVRERLGEVVDVADTVNEVDALVESFNQMSNAFLARTAEIERSSSEMRSQQESLERLVATRTAALEARHHESEDLAELTNLMQSAEDFDDAARILPLMLGRLLAPHGGAVYLDKASLNSLDSIGQFGAARCAPTMDPGNCWAMRRGRAYGATDPARDVFCGHVAPESAKAGYVCVPMHARGAPIGLLHVTLGGGADEREPGQSQAHIQRVAEQVAVGLANLKLRTALREQSIRDTLTGLFNRRYLEEALDQDLARAKRDRKPLGVFMLDVDHFKRFNDSHGHEAGDATLRSLGRVLKESARVADTVCRFGGEEFTAVLPDTPPEQARAWALRLLDRVRSMTVVTGGQALSGVTISMGLACFPGESEDADGLLRAADAALYEAKHSGRDRLVVAGEVLQEAA